MTLKHVHEPRTNVTLRPAWRLKDAAIERDAEMFWRRERLLFDPANVDSRLDEVCMAGFAGDTLIALSTAHIRYVAFLGVKLAMLRVAISADKRRNRLATIIQAESRELLEQWSANNPAEEVMGMGTVTQSRELAGRGPARAFLRSSHFGFICWTANGEPMRVAWFEHARIPEQPPESVRPTPNRFGS